LPIADRRACLRAVPRPSRAVVPPEAPRLEDETLMESATAADLPAGDARLSGVRLVDADLSGSRLRGLRLADVVVQRGNLANLVAPELSLRRVAVSGTRLTGAQWTGGNITDARFVECRIDLATFAGTTFERAAFEDCRLTQADFQEALLRSVRFDRCDLTGVDFTGLRVDRCELRGCTLEDAAALERLRGAAMPWDDVLGNAGVLAAALGIRVLDDAEP
jgi:uncharacterized protein YjbI with pentapeptide repeats